MPWCCQVAENAANLTHEKIDLQGGTRRPCNELKNEKSAKATQILVGVDAHLRGYQGARKVDNAAIGSC
jgi:hypothetical protein